MAEKTPAQKMSMKPGARGCLVNSPADAVSLIGGLPDGFILCDQPNEPMDFILLFAGSRQELETELPRLKSRLKPAGLLWVAYHKGTSGVKTDINRDSLRGYAATIGLEAVALVAIDEDWSAMRLKVTG